MNGGERLTRAAEEVLAATGPSEVPADLAARAVRAALAELPARPEPSFLDRLIATAWRTAAVATVAAVLLLILFGGDRGDDGGDGDEPSELELISELEPDSFDPTADLMGDAP